jgi:hypothetical protein
VPGGEEGCQVGNGGCGWEGEEKEPELGVAGVVFNCQGLN